MTDAQCDALTALKATFKAAQQEMHVEQDGDRVIVSYKKKRGAWYGHITILPDGRREFGRR